ncbi:MAG TPA: GTP cyclohydrolase FolE2 [Thermomonas sp.]|nr:GTP cyclohydrolase FolE2 [Thermomonas sp.]
MHKTNRHASLPDVAFDAAALARPLDWVGMDAMALPIRLHGENGQALHVPASVDVAVDLEDASARGIHMSRLYMQLQQSLANEALSAPALRKLLETCIATQQGLSTRARLRLRYDHLLLRTALASANAGWKNYPVVLEAELRDGHLHLSLAFSVEYSSTCPASAALSRQVNADRFEADFAGTRALSGEAVRDWLASERGLAATPHAQRSRAEVRVELKPAFDELPLRPLVDLVEAALGTPVQTAVKREDEQAFAELNAANLMFCEDAARRVAAALATDARVSAWRVRVAHFESLHPHDAVASVSGRNS